MNDRNWKHGNEYLSFDDVLLVPQYSEIFSRRDVDISSQISDSIKLDVPIISANMPSVTDVGMAVAMRKNGALGILHRFVSVEKAASDFGDTLIEGVDAGVSLGLEDGLARALVLQRYGANLFCVDVAHGDNKRVVQLIKELKFNLGEEITVIAGNIATLEAGSRLLEAGADILKVGIGPGAACITREVTGFGIPQFSAIMEVALLKEHYDVKIIADGGIKNSGDIVKALAAGADAVMIGSLLAGVDESPEPGVYYGSASARINNYNSPEGVVGTVERSGPLESVLKKLVWGIRSGFSYAGAENLAELHHNCEYVRVSPQSLNESRARVG